MFFSLAFFSLPRRHQVIKGIKLAACGLGFNRKGAKVARSSQRLYFCHKDMKTQRLWVLSWRPVALVLPQRGKGCAKFAASLFLPQRHEDTTFMGIKLAACGLGFTAKGQRLREVR